MDKLEGYFDSYIKSFEYLSRKRLLSCDEYTIRVAPLIKDTHIKRHKYKYRQMPSREFKLKRANFDDSIASNDFAKICDYYADYLKKYDMFEDDEAVRKNIEFWMRFGCILYIEGVEGIKLMIACTVRTLAPDSRFEDIEKILQFTIFSKYNNNLSQTLADGVRDHIAQVVAYEQGLTNILSVCTVPAFDPISYAVVADHGKFMPVRDIPGFVSNYGIHSEKPDHELDETEKHQLKAFFNTFDEVQSEAEKWCLLEKNKGLDWMLCFIKDNYSVVDEARAEAKVAIND